MYDDDIDVPQHDLEAEASPKNAKRDPNPVLIVARTLFLDELDETAKNDKAARKAAWEQSKKPCMKKARLLLKRLEAKGFRLVQD